MGESLGSFFARKLGGAAQPQQQQQGYPVQQLPVYPQQQQQQQYQQPQTQQQEIPDQQLAQMKAQGLITFSQGVSIAMARWAGDRKKGAARYETESCPECGGPHFFTRAKLGKRGAVMAAPAPMCMDCGYNGLYDGLVAPEVSGTEPIWGEDD